MKHRLFALVLAACLLATPAHAAEDGTGNFVRTKSYQGQFTDLTEQSTFYANVVALYEYGLTVGTTGNTYGAKEPVTVGQVLIFAGRLRSLYRTGDPEAGAAAYTQSTTAKAVPYLRYLQAEGVVGSELDSLLTAYATRAQTAHVLANTLPETALPRVHSDLVNQCYATRRFIPDVTEYTPYFQDILTLYRCGVVVGSDAVGTFYPDSTITRGAVAAMLTRIIDPALRETPGWQLEDLHSLEGIALSDLVAPGSYVQAPATEAEMDGCIRYMLATGSNTLSLRYPALTSTQAQQIMTQALQIIKRYCEQGYNSATCTYTPGGSLTLRFSAVGAGTQLESQRQAALDRAVAVHDQLWQEGRLRSGMTQREIAWVYYTWICENTVYDYEADGTSLSHTPYGLFQYGKAVCDGYTGAYNLFLKLEGIPCSALSGGENHIWTVATLDGTNVHIDTTWGDQDTGADATYFAMTPAQSYQYHPW